VGPRPTARQRLEAASRSIFLLLVAGLIAAPVWAARGDEQGRRDSSLDPCDAHWDVGRRAEARRCYGALAVSSDSLAVRAEAYWALGDLKRANEFFRDAIKAEPENPALRVRWGFLFLQTHAPGEALTLFNEAIEIDENHVAAKLGVAGVLAGRFDEKARKLVEEVLAEDGKLLEAHLLLALMALEEGDLKTGEAELDAASELVDELERSPLPVYALRASLDLLRGVTESSWTGKALDLNPRYGEIYSKPAHFYVITRRYREAIELLEKSVRVDPESWEAHAELGVNLLRENREQEGRRHLEISFEGDPYSAKTVNSLRLADSFGNFQVFSNREEALLLGEEAMRDAALKPEVVLRLHKDEAKLLKPYVMELTEKSMEEFSAKYGYTPDRPVHVELYPDHDDFAVRTMGMPGVGLLGVTFGFLVAMDSPSGREPGSFHWGTTLWHEMAHVFTLEATNHLVPRWYSEGISMYEEWEARPNWGERITPDFVEAYVDEKLLPVADLDKGFMRPSYPNQIAVSYFQAGLICQFIDREWGFERLVEMLHRFAGEISTADNIEQTLGIPSEEFDTRFQDFLKEKLGKLGEDGLKAWRAALKESLTAARKEDWNAAVEPAKKAKEIYPDYVESGSPYVLLAEAYDKSDDRDAAIAELTAYFKRGGRSPKTLKKLAGWLTEADRGLEAAEALEELLWVWPLDEELHAKLGDLWLEQGKTAEAEREFQALLALDPLDKASAHYRLAQAYHRMDDSKKTRRHLLMALEAAPSYRPAQKLLLEITR